MTRITNSNLRLLCLAAATACLAGGCSKPYEHRQLAGDSPQADQVRRLLQVLREQPPERLAQAVREQQAAGLTPAQEQALHRALGELARAESADLLRADAFGERLVRATFRRKHQGQTTDVALLLVADKAGRLRWAGPNG